ncbi:MAG: TolC family protein [Pirellulaceae bacterium]|nr:TolC family protein [Pirellulaceae bacterium]
MRSVSLLLAAAAIFALPLQPAQFAVAQSPASPTTPAEGYAPPAPALPIPQPTAPLAATEVLPAVSPQPQTILPPPLVPDSPTTACPPQAVPWRVIYPEERSLQIRGPAQMRYVPLPPTAAPPTVSRRDPEEATIRLSLDDAIRIALENDRVVRVLAGATAVNSGRTIYDVAIAATQIDQQQARFDPFLTVNNNWDYLDLPSAFPDPIDPDQSIIGGVTNNHYRLNAAVVKENPLGGEWRIGFDATDARRSPGDFLLNPESNTAAEIRYTQPLLQGFGREVNLAPIVLARIDTERSFFQLKDAVQEQVRGVIEAYWNLVAARVDVWATEQQVKQGEFAKTLAEKEWQTGNKDKSDFLQAQTSWYTFQANLIAARNNAIQREAALRNLLGLPPWDRALLVPFTEPTTERLEPDWGQLVELAAGRRPDLIELKLILEADEQQIIVANNNARPRLDAVGLYRWNGLSGEMPSGNGLSSAAGQFNDWTMGVNFSVPLGLRQARAQLRQRELILARDQANLDQGLHAVSHNLATTVRALDESYMQYEAFRAARDAATQNLPIQAATWRNGTTNFLNVLQAITDWGNSVRSEATALSNYNTLLAELELQTGTILETHGVRFYEERFGAIGPLGRRHPAPYPAMNPPGPNAERHPEGSRAAEQFFNLTPPVNPPEPRRPMFPPAAPPIAPTQ